jgi:transposase
MEDPMRVARPTYTQEFRQDAVALMKSTDRTFREVASDLGVSTWSLRQWYKDAEVPKKSRKQRKAETAAQHGNESAEQKLARLERENQTLRK